MANRPGCAFLAILTLAACDSGTVIGDPSDAAPASLCSGGPTRCFGIAYQTCVDGEYQTTAECASLDTCLQDVGCTACAPGIKTCVGDAVHDCNPDGTLGAELEVCQPGECTYGHCGSGDGCSSAARLIYVLDNESRLYSFDPANGNTFTSLGQLACPRSYDSGPFSMSVDRTGRAWVLYLPGELFHVTTDGNATCTRTAWPIGNGGFNLFGMGFVSDSPGATTEKLYVASTNYGWVDPETLGVQTIGPTQGGCVGNTPELTGTGNAELYAFCPGNPQVVSGIDKTSGAEITGRHWEIPGLVGQDVFRWAFAHWGGDFYLFVTTRDASETATPQVWKLDPDTGESAQILAGDSVPAVVGAGVSTCAPVYVP